MVCAIHDVCVCVPMMCVRLVSQSQCVWLAIALAAFVLYMKSAYCDFLQHFSWQLKTKQTCKVRH